MKIFIMVAALLLVVACGDKEETVYNKFTPGDIVEHILTGERGIIMKLFGCDAIQCKYRVKYISLPVGTVRVTAVYGFELKSSTATIN